MTNWYETLDALCQDSLECSLKQLLANREYHETQEVARLFLHLYDQIKVLSNFGEACCEIVERSRDPIREISERLEDIRPIVYSPVILGMLNYIEDKQMRRNP